MSAVMANAFGSVNVPEISLPRVATREAKVSVAPTTPVMSSVLPASFRTTETVFAASALSPFASWEPIRLLPLELASPSARFAWLTGFSKSLV
jgi:hypothetical protein